MTDRLHRLQDMRTKADSLTKRADAMPEGAKRDDVERTRDGILNLFYACASPHDLVLIAMGDALTPAPA